MRCAWQSHLLALGILMRLRICRSVGEVYSGYTIRICVPKRTMRSFCEEPCGAGRVFTALRCDDAGSLVEGWENGSLLRHRAMANQVTTTTTITISMPARQPAHHIPQWDTGTAVWDDALGYQSLISISMRRRTKLALKSPRTKHTMPPKKPHQGTTGTSFQQHELPATPVLGPDRRPLIPITACRRSAD